MGTRFWTYVLCCLNCMVLCSNARRPCSDTVEYIEGADSRMGTFQLNFGQPENNSYIQVIVFVDSICQTNFCTLEVSRNASILYRYGMPVTFTMGFQSVSRLADIKGIALRNSEECIVLCENPQRRVESDVKRMRWQFYPYGRNNHNKADCDPIQNFQRLNIKNKVEDINLTPTEERCGVISPMLTTNDLVVGGEAIQRGSWPWLVALNQLKDISQIFLCDGTLISKKIVLTANRCLYDRITEDPLRPEELLLFMGRHDRTDYNEQHFVQYNVHHIVRHHDYRPTLSKYYADIGLLVLDRLVQYTDFIRPACLWEESEDIDSLVGDLGEVVGWAVDENGVTSRKPVRVNATATSDALCLRSNPSSGPITTKRTFCVKYLGRTGRCTGDVGSALMLQKNNRWMVRGISLLQKVPNHFICNTDNYAAFTDLVKFKPWLNEEIAKYSEQD